MSAPAPLACRDIAVRRGRREVLRDVSIQIRAGRRTALLGANGAGKTTLLRVLLGLLKPDTGEVLLDGVPRQTLGRKAVSRLLAYVPQEHVAVFPYRVEDVVAMANVAAQPPWRHTPPHHLHAAHAALERMAIAHLAARPYTELSGGERRSVLIARALAQGAHTLVLDEPTTGLDYGQQLRLQALLQGLSEDGYAILATTHAPLQLSEAFEDAILLRDGAVDWAGAASDLSRDRIERFYGIPASAPAMRSG